MSESGFLLKVKCLLKLAEIMHACGLIYRYNIHVLVQHCRNKDTLIINIIVMVLFFIHLF